MSRSSHTPVVLLLVRVLVLDQIRETQRSTSRTSTGTSTSEKPEYAYDEKAERRAAFSMQSCVDQLEQPRVTQTCRCTGAQHTASVDQVRLVGDVL